MTPTPEEVRALVARIRLLHTPANPAIARCIRDGNDMPCLALQAADAFESEHAARLAAERQLVMATEAWEKRLTRFQETFVPLTANEEEMRQRVLEEYDKRVHAEARAQALEAALRALVDAVDNALPGVSSGECFDCDDEQQVVITAARAARELLDPKES